MALGDSESGKMAILKAIAERHGVADDETLRKLASGEAQTVIDYMFLDIF